MGNTPSVYLKDKLIKENFVIQLGFCDRLRLLLAPGEIIDVTKDILASTWKIQEIAEQEGFIEFKIKGTPWNTSGTDDVNGKYFFCSLLKEFYRLGWHLKTSTDLVYEDSDLSTMIFEKQNYFDTSVICINLFDTDKIRVLAPDTIFSLVKESILSFWPNDIQREKQVDRCYEFKLKGNPWSTWTSETTESYLGASVINNIFELLYQRGWIFAASIDSNRHRDSISSMYFYYKPDETHKPENRDCIFFSLVLAEFNQLVIVNALPDLIDSFRCVLPKLWSKGVNKETNINKCHQFHLAGAPWQPSDGQQVVESKKFFSELLSFLSELNWYYYALCDLSSGYNSKNTFFFRQTVTRIEKPFKTLCINLDEADKIRVIGGDDNIKNIVRACIKREWHQRGGLESECEFYDSTQFTLKRKPFNTVEAESIYICPLMMNLLNDIQSQGYKFIVSADLSGQMRITHSYSTNRRNDTTDYKQLDLDSWFFATETLKN